MATTAASFDFPCEQCAVRDTAVCGALTEDELRVLNTSATSVKLISKQTIFVESDEASFLFNVVRGGVRLSKDLPDGRRQITGFLHPGDFLGLAVNGSYAYSADAVGPTELCRFDRTKLVEIMREIPNLEHRILELASNELVEAQNHMLLLGRKTAEERVCSTLIKFADRLGRSQDGCVVFELDVSRAELADYLGLTTETVSRTFSTLHANGLIEMPHARTVIIPDLGTLDDHAGNY